MKVKLLRKLRKEYDWVFNKNKVILYVKNIKKGTYFWDYLADSNVGCLMEAVNYLEDRESKKYKRNKKIRDRSYKRARISRSKIMYRERQKKIIKDFEYLKGIN